MSDSDDEIMLVYGPPPKRRRTRASGSHARPIDLSDDELVDDKLADESGAAAPAAETADEAEGENEDDDIVVIGTTPARRPGRRARTPTGHSADPIELSDDDDDCVALWHGPAPKWCLLPFDSFPHIVLDVLLNPVGEQGFRGPAGINRWFLEEMDARHPTHCTVTGFMRSPSTPIAAGTSITIRTDCGAYLGVKRTPRSRTFLETDGTFALQPQAVAVGLFNFWPQQGIAEPEVIVHPDVARVRVLDFQTYPATIEQLALARSIPATVVRGNLSLGAQFPFHPWTVNEKTAALPDPWRNWDKLSTLVFFGETKNRQLSLPPSLDTIVFNIDVPPTGTIYLPLLIQWGNYQDGQLVPPKRHIVYHFRKKVKTKVATLAKHIGNDLAGSINAERQYTIINFPGTHRLLASGNRQGRLDLEDSFLDSIVERVSNNGEQGRTIDADVVHSSVKFYTDHEYHRHIGSPKWHELFAPISMDPWVRTPRPRRRNAASTSTTAA